MNTKTKTPTIAMAGVKSSQVESVGFDPATNTLAVKFIRTPSIYHYHDVTAEQFAALQKADSIGSHVHRTYVKTKHKFTKIEAESKSHA